MTCKEFQDYYANKFQRNNPLPWQDGMQAIIWWVTQSVPKNTRVTLVYGNENKVEISGDGTDTSPYNWAFTLDIKGFIGPQGPTGGGGLHTHKITITHAESNRKWFVTLYAEKSTALTYNEISKLVTTPTPASYRPGIEEQFGVCTLLGSAQGGPIDFFAIYPDSAANFAVIYTRLDIPTESTITDDIQ